MKAERRNLTTSAANGSVVDDIIERDMRKALFLFITIVVALMSSCFERRIPSGADEKFISTMEAAQSGNADSMFLVAFYLANGKHVTKNLSASWRWFIRAADKNNAKAMNCIGVSYRDSIYVEQDYQKAKEWLEKAVKTDKKDPIPLANLALTYAVGFHDFKNAHKYADMAVELAPTELFVLGAKGRICLMQNDRKGALVYLKRCNQLRPHYISSNAPFAIAARAYADSIKASLSE